MELKKKKDKHVLTQREREREREQKEEEKKTPTDDKPLINHCHTLHQENEDVVALLGTRWKTKFEQQVASHASPKEHEHHQRANA